KKSYDKWNLKKVSSEIYNNEFNFIDSMNNFKVKELLKLTFPFSKEELKRFIDNILEKLLEYRFLDYAVMIRKILILVNKAKFFEIKKAIAQNLVQIYSAVEVRFLANETLYQSFFMISMGLMEVYLSEFISGMLELLKAEITEEYVCEFRNNNMKSSKKVVDYIVRILQTRLKPRPKELAKTRLEQQEERKGQSWLIGFITYMNIFDEILDLRKREEKLEPE
ncbi:11828_t:CDS:2, partial [Funneliformis mosseae]